MIDGFSHIGIRAHPPDEVASTLEIFLGAERIDDGEFGFADWNETVEFIGLKLGEMNIFVIYPTPYEASGEYESVPDGIAHFGVLVDSCEQATDMWTEKGGDVLLKPFNLGDTRYGFVEGGNGIRVELVERIDG